VWRLAVEILSWDEVLCGPSLDVKSQRTGFSVEQQPGDLLWDDELTELELDLICGAGICYTGMWDLYTFKCLLTCQSRTRCPNGS
jgi:hypothetical protein